MKKLTQLLIVLFALMNVNFVWAEDDDYTAEIDYVVLDKPVKTITGDKVEVRELFWYSCEHCFNAEPLVENWLKNKPKAATFVRQPAVFSQRWLNGAVFYYALEELGELDRLHTKLFDAIHVHDIRFAEPEDFIDWLVDNGVKEAKAEAALKSFAVRVKVNKSAINTRKYHIEGVPTFVVNGKYWISGQTAGGQKRIFDIINYLVKQESKVAKKPNKVVEKTSKAPVKKASKVVEKQSKTVEKASKIK